ncbi:hypothetical protein M885DRAFT_611845 [Pelagophyceae sp. CCMP2097]|nr:hypothetical protein M885DRAFT_611845 [Pelagophyceae sp. CCMP2097]
MADAPPAAAQKPCCACAAPGDKHCTECKSRRYCSKACQLVYWKRGHKAQCKRLAVEFQDRLLDELMPEMKLKEEPVIAAARLSAVRLEKTVVKAAALNGDAADWRGTCAICLDLLPIEVRRMQKHADKGHVEAQSYDEAVRWWRLATAQGYAQALYKLGVLYGKGQGVPQDDGEALSCFKRAAAKGHVAAAAQGDGVDLDLYESHSLCRLAALKGNANAVVQLVVQIEEREALARCQDAQAAGPRGAENVALGVAPFVERSQRVVLYSDRLGGDATIVVLPNFLDAADIHALVSAGRTGVRKDHDRHEQLAFSHDVWRFEKQLRVAAPKVYRKVIGAMLHCDKEVWRCVPGGDDKVDNSSCVTMIAVLSQRGIDFDGGVNLFEDGRGGKIGCGKFRELAPRLGDAVFFRGEKCEHSLTAVTRGCRSILQIELCRKKEGYH